MSIHFRASSLSEPSYVYESEIDLWNFVKYFEDPFIEEVGIFDLSWVIR